MTVIYLILQALMLAGALTAQWNNYPAAADRFVYTGIILNMAFWGYACRFRKRDRSTLVPPGVSSQDLSGACCRTGLKSLFISAALLCTLAADTLLVLLDTCYIGGVLLFCCVQVMYACYLQTGRVFVPDADGSREAAKGKYCIWVLRILAYAAALAVLFSCGDGGLLQVLALFSIAQLTINAGLAVFTACRTGCRGDIIFAAGLFLFLGCDICVGLRNINVSAALQDAAYRLNWVFYLPSQALIVLGADYRKGEDYAG